MSKLSDLVVNYLKENNISINDLKDELNKLEIEVVNQFLKPEDTLVIKKNGDIEKYDPEKLERSIKNAAGDAKAALNTSDLAIILSDVDRKLDELPRKVYRTSEIKDYVIESLIEEGYTKVYENYLTYIQNF
ncbi:MAG: ATP cone domain-containing protein [Anaerococcus sp.]|nr:ATP cone domain-containing protein [Anaerococcus sp.]